MVLYRPRLVEMSKICLTTNISLIIFVSTCKQLTQSEPIEFSKNGVRYSKDIVIIFQNNQIEILLLPYRTLFGRKHHDLKKRLPKNHNHGFKF